MFEIRGEEYLVVYSSLVVVSALYCLCVFRIIAPSSYTYYLVLLMFLFLVISVKWVVYFEVCVNYCYKIINNCFCMSCIKGLGARVMAYRVCDIVFLGICNISVLSSFLSLVDYSLVIIYFWL